MKRLLLFFCFITLVSTQAQKDKVVISIYSKAYHQRLEKQAKEIETTIQNMVNQEVCEYIPASKTIPMMRKFYQGVKPTAPYLYKTFEITPDFREWLKSKNVDYLIMAGINFSKSKQVVLFYRVLPVIEEKEDKDYLQVSTPKEMKEKLMESLQKTNLVRYTNSFFDQLQQENLGWFGEKMPDGLVKKSIPGQYLWEKDGSPMVFIPQGDFLINGETKEIPSYYMDKYEVTNKQFAIFLNEKEQEGIDVSLFINLESPYCLIEKKQAYRSKKNTEDYPVVEISWDGASAYAQWAGKQLPLLDHWQKGFHGGTQVTTRLNGQVSLGENPATNRKFAWGNTSPDTTPIPHCNYYQQSLDTDGYKWLAPVTSFGGIGDSPYGCSNMTGNVWEWCNDGEKEKTCCGGAWSSNLDTLQNGSIQLPGSKTFNDVGFRSILILE